MVAYKIELQIFTPLTGIGVVLVSILFSCSNVFMHVTKNFASEKIPISHTCRFCVDILNVTASGSVINSVIEF